MKIGTTSCGLAALALTLVALVGCGGKSSSTTSTTTGGGGGGGGTGSTNNEWTWIGGPNTALNAGTYGTLGTGSSSNIPPSRYGIASWTDASGNFYIFGGCVGDAGTVTCTTFGNDLWRYSPASNQWTWLSGSNQVNQSGTYGTLNTPGVGNVPGARFNPAFWKDTSGNLWLFGGNGFDSTGAVVYLNDLWKYTVTGPNANQWTWIGGANAKSVFGVYGTLGVAAASNQPGGRLNSVSWTDASGNFWLFGGAGLALGGGTCTQSTCSGNLSDLWKYTPSTNQWTWVAGPNTLNAPSTYGTKGTAAAGNTPSGRYDAVGWVDSSNNLWLFGGSQGTGSTYDPLNDLWKFSTSSGQWTWVAGSNTSFAPSVYGTQGSAAATNTPGARVGSFTWVDSSGNLWLFGGTGCDSSSTCTATSANTLNDLWKFSNSSSQWTWVQGPKTGGATGTYGTMGTPAANNVPGGRLQGASWIDSSGNLWLFGGLGYGASGKANTLNDLWKYQP